MPDHDVLTIPDFVLESGAVLRPARLAYRTYGTLAPDGSNAVLLPTAFADDHTSNEWLVGRDSGLDPDRYFVIVPNLFGNGLSSSPSNTPPPHDGPAFPRVTMRDNVRAQRHLVASVLGIERLQLVAGWSLAALQTYEWAVGHPEMVARALPFCGAPRVSRHAFLFFEGVKAALRADAAFAHGHYDVPPRTGLRAFGAGYAAWAFSQAFYRDESYRQLGFATVTDFLTDFWEVAFTDQDANDLLTMLDSGQHADLAATPRFGGDLGRALATVRAKVVSMPAEQDLYFPPEDEEQVARHIPDAEVRVIPGTWGHFAGRGVNPDDNAVLVRTMRELLAAPLT